MRNRHVHTYDKTSAYNSLLTAWIQLDIRRRRTVPCCPTQWGWRERVHRSRERTSMLVNRRNYLPTTRFADWTEARHTRTYTMLLNVLTSSLSACTFHFCNFKEVERSVKLRLFIHLPRRFLPFLSISRSLTSYWTVNTILYCISTLRIL